MKNKIKLSRVEQNITQIDLAEKVQVSRQTIHAMEKGKYAPSTVLALKMAVIFDKKVEDLFELEEGDWE